MNKSKSYPIIYENESFKINKSQSSDNLKDKLNDFYFEDFFEGDGPLGIEFIESNQKIIVKNIKHGTVAAETYGLNRRMELVDVNNNDITKKSFDKVMKMINKSWDDDSRVYLKLKKIIIPEVSKILNQNDLLKYYDEFIELGAKSLEDFEYVEYGDLVKMGMNKSEIVRFTNINANITPH